MGNWFTSLFTFQQEKRLLMLGLDAAGKTTILYKLKLGECVTSIPTIGFNVEEVAYKNFKMNIWDIGGQDKIRQLWRHYYDNTDGLIFVIDAADPSRFGDVYEELQKLHREPALYHVPFLIFANKQDLPNALSVSQCTEQLQIPSLMARHWKVQSCSATRGEGLYEGLDWLRNELNKN